MLLNNFKTKLRIIVMVLRCLASNNLENLKAYIDMNGNVLSYWQRIGDIPIESLTSSSKGCRPVVFVSHECDISGVYFIRLAKE